jgi:DNA-binding XRE family transcriptional regulator
MRRKARVPQTVKGQFYELIEQKIILCEAAVNEFREAIIKYYKMGGLYGPSLVGGIDYSREPSNLVKIGFAEALIHIQKNQDQLDLYLEELGRLQKLQKEMKENYSLLDETESKVFYFRVIQKNTQEETAELVGISTRQVQRIEKNLKESQKIF